MKKVLLVLLLLCSGLLFAEEFVIKVGDSFNSFQTKELNFNYVCIYEIHVEDNICKLSIGNYIIYLKKGDFLKLDYYLQDGNVESKDEDTLDKEKWLNKTLVTHGKEPYYSDILIQTKNRIIDFSHNKIITEVIYE